ncbi:MAG: FliH/SctL family protein [Verrucomicrobiota bacterium]
MPLLLEKIRISEPLRDVRMGLPPHSAAQEARICAREQAAYERGRREGEKALSEQLVRQRGEIIELQNGVLHSLRQSISQVTRECEGAMVALALEIAGKLVADLPISSEMIEASVREALSHVEQKGTLTVLLNPMDFELLQQANAPVLLSDIGGERLKFQAAANVSRGGCLVQTQFGVVDARRETKLEALKQSLESSCN